ncbi:MAG: hypothetical protein F6K10_12175 [Moorea sp. SIO2B7]|nr:hypothetical protein [Moorena sp. SIO2B7]
MRNIRKLMKQLAAQEVLLNDTEFLAPCVGGGKVRTSVENIVYTFSAKPEDFEGWGIFKPLDNRVAEVIDEPSLPQLAEYLKLLKPLRLRLAYGLRGQTWLAYPVNESDMQQRFGTVKPVAVHLVTEGAQFEPIIARNDGNSWWFEEIDRRAEPQPTVQLWGLLREETPSADIHFAGMTPEMLTVYDLAWQQTEAAKQRRELRRQARKPQKKPQESEAQVETTEERLQQALRQGGGEMQGFRDRGEFWQVEWRTADGDFHASAIDKNDLTVISSGICLSGRDRDFDLQSLVGVIEKRDW